MRIAITGVGGQLGSEFLRQASRQPGLTVSGYGRNAFDLSNAFGRQAIMRQSFDCLINCAAYTNVEKAEEEKDLSRRLNADAPAELAEECARLGRRFIHFSTDYVFDGRKRVPYLETDECNPLNVYGKSKWEGEQRVMEAGGNATIFRLSWLYGRTGQNFLHTMLKLSENSDSLRIVNDQVSSPTNAADVVEDVLDWLRRDSGPSKANLVHYSQDGSCSWAEFTSEIFRLWKRSCEVIPIPSSEFPQKAIRPAYSKLDNSFAVSNLGFRQKSWQEGLEKCFKAMND